MKVYTKRGDDGTTGLLYGGRVDKDDLRTEAYGTVDEAVSALGMARADLDVDLAEHVLLIQRELFALGAQLATRSDDWERLEVGVSQVDQAMVDRIDGRIDEMTESHPLPQEFIVPGGSRPAAAIDLARTIIRRAERAVVRMKKAELLPDEAPLRYLNRLSDELFVLARVIEGEHIPSRIREQS